MPSMLDKLLKREAPLISENEAKIIEDTIKVKDSEKKNPILDMQIPARVGANEVSKVLLKNNTNMLISIVAMFIVEALTIFYKPLGYIALFGVVIYFGMQIMLNKKEIQRLKIKYNL